MGLLPVFCQYALALVRISNEPVMLLRLACPLGTTMVTCFIGQKCEIILSKSTRHNVHFTPHNYQIKTVMLCNESNKKQNFMTTSEAVMTIQEVAARFNELARQEKWFEIQDELFAYHVRSMEAPNSLHLKYAEGKGPVRKKGEEFVKKVQEFHGASTTH